MTTSFASLMIEIRQGTCPNVAANRRAGGSVQKLLSLDAPDDSLSVNTEGSVLTLSANPIGPLVATLIGLSRRLVGNTRPINLP